MAHFYIGTTNLRQGRRESAKQHFQEVVQTGRIGWGVYLRAKAFLNRMENDPKWPGWIPKKAES